MGKGDLKASMKYEASFKSTFRGKIASFSLKSHDTVTEVWEEAELATTAAVLLYPPLVIHKICDPKPTNMQ